MKRIAAGVFCLFLGSVLVVPAQADEGGEEGRGPTRVDCEKGETISQALKRTRQLTDVVIEFSGTCSEEVLVARDDVTLRGVGEAPTVVGFVRVDGGTRVEIRDFSVHGRPDMEPRTDIGGIDMVNGAGVVVENMRVENINARGVKAEGASAVLHDVFVRGAEGGAFVFRGSSLVLGGEISATDSIFGLSLVNSGATVFGGNLSLNRNFVGLIVQISSGLEYVQGQLTTNENVFGAFVLGLGLYTYGNFIEIKDNLAIGLFIDELSDVTPLLGAPGGGPSLLVSGNGDLGIGVERDSDVVLTAPATITGNGVGLAVDNSLVTMDGSTIEGNADADVRLAFGAKATFLQGNHVAGVACDGTVLTRGGVSCTVPLRSPDVSATTTLQAMPSAVRATMGKEIFWEAFEGPALVALRRFTHSPKR